MLTNAYNGFAPVAPLDTRLIGMVGQAGLSTSLSFCLDAGDANSYAGSGQQWSDVSGQGNHYYRGADNTATTDDPTFAGTAGGLSESDYFSFDGGDYFSPVGSPTFDDGWSKDGGVFSVAVVFYSAASGSARALIGNAGATGHDGVLVRINTGDTISLYHDTDNSGAAGQIIKTTTATITAAKPNLVIATLDETVPQVRIKVNRAAVETFSTTASALTNNPAILSIGSFGAGTQKLGNGDRIYGAMAWSGRYFTSAEMDAFATLVATRFPNMP